MTDSRPPRPDGPPPSVRQERVPDDREGQRLDNFLFGLLKGVPKTHVYRLLRTGQVRVDGKRAKPDQRLAGGEMLRIPPVRVASPGDPVQASERSLRDLGARIVLEDRNFIALDKPSGLASHDVRRLWSRSRSSKNALRRLPPRVRGKNRHNVSPRRASVAQREM